MSGGWGNRNLIIASGITLENNLATSHKFRCAFILCPDNFTPRQHRLWNKNAGLQNGCTWISIGTISIIVQIWKQRQMPIHRTTGQQPVRCHPKRPRLRKATVYIPAGWCASTTLLSSRSYKGPDGMSVFVWRSEARSCELLSVPTAGLLWLPPAAEQSKLEKSAPNCGL